MISLFFKQESSVFGHAETALPGRDDGVISVRCLNFTGTSLANNLLFPGNANDDRRELLPRGGKSDSDPLPDCHGGPSAARSPGSADFGSGAAERL